MYKVSSYLTTSWYNQLVALYCIDHLHTMANQFFRDGLAAFTTNTYSTAQERFINFCTATKFHPVPATEATLVLFATHLATGNISHTTIKVYLSVVRHLHVSVGLHDYFNLQLTPRLQQVLQGIKKMPSTDSPPRICLPITLQIMC